MILSVAILTVIFNFMAVAIQTHLEPTPLLLLSNKQHLITLKDLVVQILIQVHIIRNLTRKSLHVCKTNQEGWRDWKVRCPLRSLSAKDRQEDGDYAARKVQPK